MLCILKGGFTVFFVSLERSARSNTLTLTEFVPGYAQILLSKDISPLEWKEREKDTEVTQNYERLNLPSFWKTQFRDKLKKQHYCKEPRHHK